jgi:hypothetical protein
MLKMTPASCFFLFVLVLVSTDAYAGKCAPGKQILWYYGDPNLDAKIQEGFSDHLFKDLSAPLSALGYCLTKYIPKNTSSMVSVKRENLLLRVLCRDNDAHDPEQMKNQVELVAHLISVKDFDQGNFTPVADRPLASLGFSGEDFESVRIIFAKKIIENLRTGYICNLMITSDPPGVQVTASSGLSDATPLEWVVPVGKMDIQCNLKKYIPYNKEFMLDRPGVYNYFIQMKKRQFYHSKFFLAGSVCGVASAVCYALDNYYYNRYKNLDGNDANEDPGRFERLFTTAQRFERISLGFLAIGCSFITLSFWF